MVLGLGLGQGVVWLGLAGLGLGAAWILTWNWAGISSHTFNENSKLMKMPFEGVLTVLSESFDRNVSILVTGAGLGVGGLGLGLRLALGLGVGGAFCVWLGWARLGRVPPQD